MPSSEFVNLKDGAALLGVSERKFHALRRAGIIPEPLQFGSRCLRWSRAELVEHLLVSAPRQSRSDAREPSQLSQARETRTQRRVKVVP